jgi:glycosyltransferase involved in cell wall biosynthesis
MMRIPVIDAPKQSMSSIKTITNINGNNILLQSGRAGKMDIAVSIIVPCRNEAAFIDSFLQSLLRQTGADKIGEILIADGMSDDGTRDNITSWMTDNTRIRVIDNPEGIVSTGLNRAIKAARGNVIVRMDVHTEYDPDYLRQCIQVLEETGADNVGGPWVAVGKSYVQKAIALAFRSPFSSGGARSHDAVYEGPVDTVYLGCWRRKTLEDIGMFDEELDRNQDDELNLRLSRSGGLIWQSPRIRSRYYPRPSVHALFRQYVQYGYWKVRVIRKHHIPASFRHVIPGGFVMSLLVLLFLAPFSTFCLHAATTLFFMYASANIAVSFLTCITSRNLVFLPVLPAIFGAFHFGYGLGFLAGCVDFILLGREGRRRFSQVTR